MKQKVVNIVAICAVAILAIGGLTLFTGCGLLGQSKRKAIEKELSQMRRKLPIKVAGDDIVLIDAKLKGDMVEFKYEVSGYVRDAISQSGDAPSSDRNLARGISNLDNSIVSRLIESGVGLRIVFVSKNNNSKILFEVKADNKKLKEISEKLKSGEIQPMTLLELTELEIKSMKFPIQVDDDVWLTNEYIDGKDICIELKLKSEVDPSAIDESVLAAMKKDCAEGIREDPLEVAHKKEVIKEGINFIYIYKDVNDVEFARVKLTAEDIFQ